MSKGVSLLSWRGRLARDTAHLKSRARRPRHNNVAAFLLITTLLLTFPISASAEQELLRAIQFPPKTQRTLYTNADITTARANVTKYPSAKSVADAILKDAAYWLDWRDEDLIALIASSKVPRAFDVSASGCPICGHKAEEKFGRYCWIIDPRTPFKVKCPNDGAVFPTNDYAGYYHSNFKDKNGWDTPYTDDGWGWKNPKTGEKFWFVAYYNHWLLYKKICPGVQALAEAYLLTGDARYAHKAAVMLHRLAEIYPSTDYAKQSRYGQMLAAQGRDYPGKIVNAIWETSLITSLAQSYDAVFDTLDADAALQNLFHQTGPQIRAFIDANLLEDGIDAVYAGKIHGNFGMHQMSLVTLGIVRQFGEQTKWFDGLLNNPAGRSDLGLRYALYDLISRDGVPTETSPEYNDLWVDKISSYGQLLQRTGRDIFALPRTQKIYDAILDQICINEFTPDLGDSGNVYGEPIGLTPNIFQVAYRQYHDDRYAAVLQKLKATGDNSFKTFDSLLAPPIELESPPQVSPPASRLLPGAGLAILNNPANTISLALTYGLHHGHGHYDRLSFELFANHHPIMPDLGYPDAMNDFVPGIYTWSKNTISHNTVVVDAHRQLGNTPGSVHAFVDGPFARYLDIDGNGTYPHTTTYRRTIIMIDADTLKAHDSAVGPPPQPNSYFIDDFTIIGGSEHDYLLHGPPGKFTLIGNSFSHPRKGTLAGENIPIGQIYDDPTMSAPGYTKGYTNYTGSGFQHLFNVQVLQHPGSAHRHPEAYSPKDPASTTRPDPSQNTAQDDDNDAMPFIAEYSDEKDPSAKLRIRLLGQDLTSVYLADARVSPNRYPQLLKYIIARRQGDHLYSEFSSVLEPFKNTPFIQSVERIKLDAGNGLALKVIRTNVSGETETDIILYDSGHSTRKINSFAINTNAVTAVATFDSKGNLQRAFFHDGYRLAIGRSYHFHARPVGGFVSSVDPPHRELHIHPISAEAIDPAVMVGQTVYFIHGNRRSPHTIAGARLAGDELILTTADDLLIGLIKVNRAGENFVETSTALPLALEYIGASLTSADFSSYRTIDSIEHEGRLAFAPDVHNVKSLAAGDEMWISDVAPEDNFEFTPSFSWSRDSGTTSTTQD